MIDKYSNLSTYKILNHWILSHTEFLNQRDNDDNSILDWILHSYRGKNNYKLVLIENVIGHVALSIEQINKIFYMILTESDTIVSNKIYDCLLKNEFTNNNLYKKEIALTSSYLLKSGELSEDKIKLITKMQPNYQLMLEQININLISEAGLLNSLLLLSELQDMYDVVYDDCGIDGEEIMKKINLFLLTDINDKTIDISKKIIKKNIFLKLEKKLKSKSILTCLDKPEKVNKI